MRCPKCPQQLINIERNNVRMKECGTCLGSFIGEIQLKRLTRLEVTQSRNAGDPWANPLPQATAPGPSIVDLAALVAQNENKKQIRCPGCTVPMRKDRVHPMVPVEIDVCPKCKCAWLSGGKLLLIQKLYFELQTSEDPRIIELREKIAGARLDVLNRQYQTQEDFQTLSLAASTLSGNPASYVLFLLNGIR